jgi:hypothetical protein
MYCFFVPFSVLFVCICVLYYCHRVATQLQLNISYIISQRNATQRDATRHDTTRHDTSRHVTSRRIIYHIYHIIYHIHHITSHHITYISYHIPYHTSHIIYHIIYHIISYHQNYVLRRNNFDHFRQNMV